jgi:hypothetical protein
MGIALGFGDLFGRFAHFFTFSPSSISRLNLSRAHIKGNQNGNKKSNYSH